MPWTAAKEWPLIAFTLLSQIAVGAFWTLAAAHFFIRGGGAAGSFAAASERGLAAVVALLIVAAAFSFFHLGRPGRAGFALANLRRSWLSRELFFEVFFLAMVAFLALFSRGSAGRANLLDGAYIFASALGFFFLGSMAGIYMLRTVPNWRGPHTPLSFFLSAAVLGPLATVAGRGYFFSFTAPAFGNAVLASVLGAIALIIVTVLLFSPKTGFLGTKKNTFFEFQARRMYPFLVFRFLFLAAAVLLIVMYLEVGRDLLLVLAFVSVLTAETLGRYLFYAAYGRVGV